MVYFEDAKTNKKSSGSSYFDDAKSSVSIKQPTKDTTTKPFKIGDPITFDMDKIQTVKPSIVPPISTKTGGITTTSTMEPIEYTQTKSPELEIRQTPEKSLLQKGKDLIKSYFISPEQEVGKSQAISIMQKTLNPENKPEGVQREDIEKNLGRYQTAFLEKDNKEQKVFLDNYIKESEEKGLIPRTFIQVFKETPISKYIPFASSAVEGYAAWELYEAIQRYEKGVSTYRDDLLIYKASQEAQRDTTFGGKVAGVLVELPAFMAEFAATGGIYSGTKKAAEKTILKTINKVTSKQLTSNIGTKIVSGIIGATAQTPFSGITRIPADAIERMIPDYRIGEDVKMEIIKEGDDLFKATVKAFGNQWIENVSERSGDLFSIFGNKAKDGLIKAGLLKAFLRKNPTATPSSFMKIVKETGWNGIINEMLEERVGEVGRAILGIEDYKLPTVEQLGIELVAFSIPGVGINVINKFGGGQETSDIIEVPPTIIPIEEDVDGYFKDATTIVSQVEEVEPTVIGPEPEREEPTEIKISETKTSDEIIDYVDQLDRSVENPDFYGEEAGILPYTKKRIKESEQYRIKTVNIDDLIKNDLDLKEYIDANEQRYIGERDFFNLETPIVVGKKGEIIDGMNRILTLKNNGVNQINAYVPVEEQLTLKPSEARTPKEIEAEAKKVGMEEKGLKPFAEKPTYQTPAVTKADVKTLIANSPEFKANPILTVDEEKNLTFTGENQQFKIKAEALGLNADNLTIGSQITVDAGSLKTQKAPQQMRVYQGDEVMASPRGQKTIRKIFEKVSNEPLGKVQEVPDDFKISERAKDILKEFGIVSAERGLPNRYLGLYKPYAEKIRVQSYYDITTVTHEAVHGIDNQIGFTERLIADTTQGDKIRKQLTNIYERLYPKGRRDHPLKKRLQEGLAVLFENYFYDPVNTTETYPFLVDTFIKPTGQYYDPQFNKLLEMMNSLVEDYSKLSPEDKIASRIRTGKEIIKENKGFSVGQRVIFEVFNRFEPLKRYAKQAGVSETWDDPMIQAFNILNKNTIVSNWVKGKETPILMRDGNFLTEKGSVADYLDLVKGNEKAFRSYLIARRVFEANNNVIALKNQRDLAVSNIEPSNELVDILMTPREVIKEDGTRVNVPGLSLEDARAEARERQKDNIIKTFEAKIKKIQSVIDADDFSTQDAAAVVQKYSKKFAEAEKIFDDINKRLIVFSEENGLLDSETAATYKAEKGYASFRRFIDDELKSLGTIKTSSKTKVSSFQERHGSQLDIIDPVYSQIISINEIIGKAMENRLWQKVDGLTKDNPEIAQRFEPFEARVSVDAQGRISFPEEKDPSVIRFFVDGKRQFRKAGPEFLAMVKTLRGKEFDAFIQLLRVPASVFTRLTTSANPYFAVGNIAVDQFAATSQTKKGFKPIIDPVKGFVDYISGDEGLKAYLAVGGKRQTLASYYDLSPDDIVHQLTGGETITEKVTGVIDSSLGVFELPSNISEIITRYSEYKRSVDSGEPMSVAMYRASEVTTPFQLQGNFGGRFGQELVKSIPYFNAGIQVIYKFGRTIKDNPARLVTVTASVLTLGLTAAILLMKYGSDEQKRLISEQPVRNLSRYLYFPSPNGKDLTKLRVPEQIGVWSGMAYLYVVDKYGGNEASFNDYVDLVTSAVPEQVNITDPKKMLLSWRPQVLKPSWDVAANIKTFPEVAPIVPYFTASKKPSEQYNAYTSRVAKFLGQLSDSSPMLIEYWVKNQFGAVGSAFMGKIPSNPIIIQEKDYVMSGRAYNKFYEDRELVSQNYQDSKDNPDKYNTKEILEFKDEHKAYEKISDMLSVMRQINTKADLPEELRKEMYDLLVNLDPNLPASYSTARLNKVESKINVFKRIHKID